MKPLTAVLFAAALVPLNLQAAEAVPPDAGSILQQIRPLTPPSPASAGTGLTFEQTDGTTLPPSAPFAVSTIRISGNTLFDPATLHTLIADAESTSITLARLEELAARITDYYRNHDYPLARALIPAQTIQDGIVNIEVIEARYAEINLANSSRVKSPLLQATLAPLQSAQFIGQTRLDHALLLLSDIPGVTVAATLQPGAALGTSNLQVNTTPTSTISGNVSVDAYGNIYTGRERLSGTLNFINPLHHGDVLSVNMLSSGSELNYGRMTYESLLNGRGTRLGGAWSTLEYSLGDTLASLNANGTAQVASTWAKHPLVRSRYFNLYSHLQYDQLQLRDHVAVGAIRTDRNLANWTLSLAGDARDSFLSGAVTAWNVSATAGEVDFDNAVALLTDAATARTRGSFSKWNVNLARLQTLSARDGLYFAFSGQWAQDNLDSSLKMTAGGPFTVRAYDMGTVAGDKGYLGTIELRHDLGQSQLGQFQVVAFVDSQQVTINHSPWNTGENSATLSGAGVGLNWTGPRQWSARAYIATPIESQPVPAQDTASMRVWVEISTRF